MDYREIGFEVWTGFICLRIRTVSGLLYTRQQNSGSIERGEFLDWLPKKDSAPRVLSCFIE